MKRIFALAALAVPGIAASQVTPFEFGIGYGQSSRFDRDSGGRGRLEGPVVSISQSVFSLPVAGSVRVGASALFGGGLSQGSDTDGNVYRLFVHYKSPSLGPSGIYVLIGGHWATAKGRGGSFGEVDRAGADFGLGMGLGPGGLPVPKTSLELVAHQNKKAQLEGYTLSLKLRL
jgi:hypothetical protein